MLTEHENALVLALVRAHAMEDPRNLSWVPAYTKVRWSVNAEACRAERVGGHWRRKAHCKRTLDALACVCKQDVLAEPDQSMYMPPVGRKRNR